MSSSQFLLIRNNSLKTNEKKKFILPFSVVTCIFSCSFFTSLFFLRHYIFFYGLPRQDKKEYSLIKIE